MIMFIFDYLSVAQITDFKMAEDWLFIINY